jgi:hypothetical protein
VGASAECRVGYAHFRGAGRGFEKVLLIFLGMWNCESGLRNGGSRMWLIAAG